MTVQLGSAHGRITIDSSGVTQGVRETQNALSSVQSSFQRTGASLRQAGATMSIGLTAPIAAFGAGMVRAATAFEGGMNKVQALTNASAEDFARLQAQAKELGRVTQFSAGQAAEAMGFLAMAGFNVERIMGAMPATLQLASSAGMDLGRTADIVTNILTGYGMKVEDLAHANDVLVKAFTSANVDLTMLGVSMKYAGPIAHAMGMSFEEAAAAIGMMGNAGIQGSMAGTSLRMALGRLANPTGAAGKALRRLGVETVDSSGKLLPFVDIIHQLEASGATASDMLTIFGDRAGPAMQVLVEQGAEALAQFTAKLQDSGGVAERVGEVQMRGLGGAILYFKGSLETTMINTVEPFLKTMSRMVIGLADLVSSFSNLSPSIKNAALAFFGILAAAGPVLLIMGMVATVIGFLLTPLGAAVAAIAALAAAFAGDFLGIRTIVGNVIAAVVQWLAALNAAFVERFGTFADIFARVSAVVMGVLNQLNAAFVERFGTFEQIFARVVAWLWTLNDAFVTRFGTIQQIVAGAATALGAALTAVSNYLLLVVQQGNVFNDWLTHVPAAIQPLLIGIGQVIVRIQQFGETLRLLGTLIVAVLNGDDYSAQALLDKFGALGQAVLQQIQRFFYLRGVVLDLVARFQMFANVLAGALAGDSYSVQALLDKFGSVGQVIWTVIETVRRFRGQVEDVMDRLVMLGSLIVGVLSGDSYSAQALLAKFGDLGQVILDVIEALNRTLGAFKEFGLGALQEIAAFVLGGETEFENLRALIGAVQEHLGEAVSAIVGYVRDNLPEWIATIEEWGEALWSWVQGAASEVLAQLRSLADSVLEWAREHAGPLLERLEEWGEALWSWVQEAAPLVLDKLRELGGAVLEWVRERAGPLLERLGEWGRAFVEWVQPRISEMLGKLGDLAREALAWIRAQLPGVTERLRGWGQAFVEWVGPRIGELLGKLGDLGRDVLDWIVGQIPGVVDRLSEWGRAFVEWVGPRIGELLGKLGELGQQALAWLASQVPVIWQKLQEWGRQFIAWVAPRIPELIVQLGALLGKMATWIIGTAVPAVIKLMLTVGAALIGFVAWAATEVIPKLLVFLQATENYIKNDILPAVADAAIEVGKGIVRGIGKGIEELRGWLEEKARAIAKAAIDAAKKLLGIESPSKAFADIGEQIVAGLIAGLAKRQPDAVKQVADMAKAVGDAFSSIAAGIVDAQKAAKLLEGGGGGSLIALVDWLQEVVLAFEGFVKVRGLGNEIKRAKQAIDGIIPVVRGISESIDALSKILEFQVATSAMTLGEAVAKVRDGVDRIMASMAVAVLAIREMLEVWQARGLLVEVPAAAREMLENWAEALKVIADATSAVKALLDAGQWDGTWQEIRNAVQRGVTIVLSSMRDAIEILFTALNYWREHGMLIEVPKEAQAMLDNWRTATKSVADAASSVKALWELGQVETTWPAFRAAVQRGATILLSSLRDAVEILFTALNYWREHGMMVEVPDAAREMLENWGKAVKAIADATSAVMTLWSVGQLDVAWEAFRQNVQEGTLRILMAMQAAARAILVMVGFWSVRGSGGLVEIPAETQKLLEAWSAAIRVISDATSAVKALWGVGQIETTWEAFRQSVQEGTLRMLMAMQAAVRAIVVMLGFWSVRGALTEISAEAQRLLQSWASAVKVIADATRAVENLASLGSLETTWEGIRANVQEGTFRMLMAMQAVARAIAVMLGFWSVRPGALVEIEENGIKLLQGWASAVEAVSKSIKGILDLVDVGLWKDDIDLLMNNLRRGVEIVLLALVNAVGVIVDLFSGWTEADHQRNQIDPALEAMVKSWSDIVGALGSAVKKFGDIAGFGTFSGDLDLFMDQIRRGVALVILALNNAVAIVADSFRDWSQLDLKQNTIDPALEAMVKSWTDIVGAVAGAIKAIKALAEVGEWTVDLDLFKVAIRQGVDTVLQALQLAVAVIEAAFRDWPAEEFVNRSVTPALQDMLEGWSKIVKTVADGISQVVEMVRPEGWEEPVGLLLEASTFGGMHLAETLALALDAVVDAFDDFSESNPVMTKVLPAVRGSVQMWQQIVTLVNAAMSQMQVMVGGIGGPPWRDAALSGAFNFGRSWVAQIVAGIRSLLPDLEAVLEYIRGLFPSSPAKHGPFQKPLDLSDYFYKPFRRTFSQVNALTLAGLGPASASLAAAGGSFAAPTTIDRRVTYRNAFYLTAQYPFQTERSLRDDVRLLQMTMGT